MKLRQELFAIKLYEMEQQFGKMQSRIRICEQENPEKIHQELENAIKEYKEQTLIFQKSIEGCCSEAVAELARALVECRNKMEALLENGKLERYLHSETSNTADDHAEATTLYAEYAMDYAVQTIQFALIAALSAMEAQLDTENRKGESSCRK